MALQSTISEFTYLFKKMMIVIQSLLWFEGLKNDWMSYIGCRFFTKTTNRNTHLRKTSLHPRDTVLIMEKSSALSLTLWEAHPINLPPVSQRTSVTFYDNVWCYNLNKCLFWFLLYNVSEYLHFNLLNLCLSSTFMFFLVYIWTKSEFILGVFLEHSIPWWPILFFLFIDNGRWTESAIVDHLNN